MKNFIILIPIENNLDARKQCELIENTTFNVGGATLDLVGDLTALSVRNEVMEMISKEFDVEITNIEVEPISDFMDRCNDELLNLDNYFISYVNS